MVSITSPTETVGEAIARKADARSRRRRMEPVGLRYVGADEAEQAEIDRYRDWQDAEERRMTDLFELWACDERCRVTKPPAQLEAEVYVLDAQLSEACVWIESLLATVEQIESRIERLERRGDR